MSTSAPLRRPASRSRPGWWWTVGFPRWNTPGPVRGSHGRLEPMSGASSRRRQHVDPEAALHRAKDAVVDRRGVDDRSGSFARLAEERDADLALRRVATAEDANAAEPAITQRR